MTNASGINHAHAAIAFRAALLGIERETSRALEGAVWLRSKVLPCDASHTRDSPHRRLVGNAWLNCCAWFCHWLMLSCCEFGGAHGRWVQCMAQAEAEVLGPLREDQPEFLSPGGMRAPAVWLLLLVFIREHGLKRATMEIQSNHISRGERAWWQGRVEQLVDVLTTRGADLHWPICRRTCGDDGPRVRSSWRKQKIGEVKERPGVPVSGWVVC